MLFCLLDGGDYDLDAGRLKQIDDVACYRNRQIGLELVPQAMRREATLHQVAALEREIDDACGSLHQVVAPVLAGG